MRKVWAVIVTLGLALGLGVMTTGPAAAADPVDWVTAIEQTTTPEEVVFGGEDALPVKSVVTLAEPADWVLDNATLCVDPSWNEANQAVDCSPSTSWFDLEVGTLQGNERKVTITGEIPNYNTAANALVRGYVGLTLNTSYTHPDDGMNGTSSVDTQYIYLPVKGETRGQISGPARINVGASLTLTGKFECFGRSAFGVPPIVYSDGGDPMMEPWSDEPQIEIQLRPEGESNWITMGAADYTASTGAFRYFNLSVGATGDWRAKFYGSTGCADFTTTAAHVVSGNEDPEPPATSNAPAMVVSAKTHNTVSLDWTAPTDPKGKVEAYRIGWTSANGLPVAEWSRVYPADEMDDPFVMTNLSPSNEYTMWVEAITPAGTGARTTLKVTTNDAPPAPVIKVPTAPRSLKVAAAARSAKLSWVAPASNGGAAINAYQVKRTGNPAVTTLRATARSYTFAKLRPLTKHTVYTRAHNAKGWGPWAGKAFYTKAPAAKAYKTCAALNYDYPHGVGKPGAKDKGSGVTNFYRSSKTYKMNDGRVKSKGQYDLDRDNDKIACEKK